MLRPGKRAKVDAALAPCILGVLGTCGASVAHAQSLPAGTVPSGNSAISVQKRSRPDLDPVPVRFGGFDVTPTAETRLAYDDNVYAARTDKIDNALATLSGSISAQSTWSRHALSLDVDGAIARGLSQPAEDTDTYNLRLGGRLDLAADTQFSLNASYARAYEPRGSVGDTTLRGPRIAYNTLTLGTQFQHNAGRLILQGDAEMDSFRYAPYRTTDTTLSQAARNYRSWSTSLSAGYALSPGIATFVEGSWNQARYPDDTSGLDRSSSGWSARTGLQFGVTRLVRGRMAIGYQDQRYDDPLFPRIKGLDFGGSLEWSPTPLLTLSVEARRSIQRSPLVGVAGIRQSRYTLRADHELLRNLILTARTDYAVNEYAGVGRVQRDLSGSGGVEWLLNRNLRISAQANVQRTRSGGTVGGDLAGSGRNFDRHRLSIAVRYAL